MADYLSDAQGMQFDPITMATMLQQAPAIQQAQRRAQQLRGAQQYFQQMQGQEGTGNYTPAVAGGGKAGLYPVVQKWQPDYKAMGNQAMGALGQLMTQPAANAAEDTYNAARNQQILQGIQQASTSGYWPGAGGAGWGSGGLTAPAQQAPRQPNMFGSGNLWNGQGTGWLNQGTG